MRKWLSSIGASILTVLVVVSFFHTTIPAQAGNNGSVDTVSDCSHTNDNQFYAGDTVKGKGSNFDANADYKWTITKTDQPSQGTQTATGTFSLGSGITTFCYDLWTAAIVGGDTHSEFTWEVDEKNTDKNGNITWKKVDSDNFFVNPAQTTPTPTTKPTSTPTPTTTSTPTPTATITPTPTTTNNGGSNGGNGGGDGRSDGLSSCPQCTQAPSSNGQSVLGASTTQAVLGASTMAGTGIFETNVMNAMLLFGMIVLSSGALSYAKEKKA